MSEKKIHTKETLRGFLEVSIRNGLNHAHGQELFYRAKPDASFQNMIEDFQKIAEVVVENIIKDLEMGIGIESDWFKIENDNQMEISKLKQMMDQIQKDARSVDNDVVENMGLERKGLVEETMIGYIAVHLDGTWFRPPYLHNGSMPSLRDLLKPAQNRPKVFCRGYDVYDTDNEGFVTQGSDAEEVGSKYDTDYRGNSNEGLEYGAGLSVKDKNALVEYLKTL